MLVPSLLALFACTGARHLHVEHADSPLLRPIDAVATAPVQFFDEHVEDPLASGVFVGNLTFGGGYVTEQVETGQQNASRTVSMAASDTYRDYAATHLTAAVTLTLNRRSIPTVQWAPSDTLIPPKTQARRGTHPRDGSDNVPLPRLDIVATPLPPSALQNVPEGVDAIVVPWVVGYYTHNAGWFTGQTYGTAAGARYRVYLAVHDAQTGASLGWTDATTILIHDTIFQPNSGQTEDFLMRIESRLDRLLRKAVK